MRPAACLNYWRCIISRPDPDLIPIFSLTSGQYAYNIHHSAQKYGILCTNLRSDSHLLSIPQTKVIMGVRRCGKSVFASQLFKDKPFAYLNFDDERLISIDSSSLNTILEIFYELYGNHTSLFPILFDEIQNIQGWELFINRLQRQGHNIVITGHLTGRHIPLVLFPFSFKEFLTYKNIAFPPPFTTTNKASLRRELLTYLETGGFPESLSERINPKQYLRSLYTDIIEKDIVIRHKIRMIQALKEISLFLVINHATRMSYNKIARTFHIKSVHTVMNYTTFLEEAYLFFFLRRWSSKQKERSTAPRKVYVIDHGLITALADISSPGWGRRYENVVAVELQRRCADKAEDVFCWQNNQQHEVDFVVHSNRRIKELIQVCYRLTDERIRNREFRSLIKASDELGCRNLTVITDDTDGAEEWDGRTIRLIPLWKWLLEKPD